MQSKKYSIVIPVYKTDIEYLHRCVDSCLAQTYKNIEIILVDDGSPDLCGQICDDYQGKDSRVKVIHKENTGVSDSRNYGILNATGDFITFVDSDDWIENVTVSEVNNIIELNNKPDIVIFNMINEYPQKSVITDNLYEDKFLFYSEDDNDQIRKDVLEMKMDRNILRMTFGKFIKTSVLKESNLTFDTDLPLCEDVVFWFEAFQKAKKSYYITKSFYHYRRDSESASARYREDVVVEHDRMLSKLYAIIQSTGKPDLYTNGFSLEVFYSLQRCIIQRYYHQDCQLKAADKKREFYSLLKRWPYKEYFKIVPQSKLTFNHRIKYFLIKNRMLDIYALLRSCFFSLTGRIKSE